METLLHSHLGHPEQDIHPNSVRDTHHTHDRKRIMSGSEGVGVESKPTESKATKLLNFIQKPLLKQSKQPASTPMDSKMDENVLRIAKEQEKNKKKQQEQLIEDTKRKEKEQRDQERRIREETQRKEAREKKEKARAIKKEEDRKQRERDEMAPPELPFIIRKEDGVYIGKSDKLKDHYYFAEKYDAYVRVPVSTEIKSAPRLPRAVRDYYGESSGSGSPPALPLVVREEDAPYLKRSPSLKKHYKFYPKFKAFVRNPIREETLGDNSIPQNLLVYFDLK